jgi:CelD/BcsL family acetyltransferase involved in cellulose biosynthesis
MRSELIPLSALAGDERALAAWRRLAATAVSRNPFAEPEVVLPAARALGVHDVELLVVRDAERWLAALPVRRLPGYRRVPGRCLAAWRHEYCFLGTPLVAPDDPGAALRALIAGALGQAPCLALDWIEADGTLAEPLSEALAAASRPVVVERFERPALYHREDGAYLEQAISANHRSQYRRLRRKLEREVGPLTLRDESSDPDAAAHFLALESSGWKGERGTALANAGHGVFFAELCAGFAQTGRLRLLSLATDERRVAMSCGLLAGDTTYEFKIGFDDAYRRFSPGIQLLIAAMDQFHESGLARLDSCADFHTAWTARFLAGHRPLRSVVSTARTPAGAAQATKWRAAAAALGLQRRYDAYGGRDALVRDLRTRARALSRSAPATSPRA